MVVFTDVAWPKVIYGRFTLGRCCVEALSRFIRGEVGLVWLRKSLEGAAQEGISSIPQSEGRFSYQESRFGCRH